MKTHTPFYDPDLSYDQNYTLGPFGVFADGEKFKYKESPNHLAMGHKVHIPFGIPAGPLLNANFCKAALDKGYSIVTYKTVRTRSHPSHPLPNVLPIKVKGKLTLNRAGKGVYSASNYDHPIAITNSFGVPSKHPKYWQEDLADLVDYAKKGQLVIGSFQGTSSGNGDTKAYILDFVKGAKMVKKTGVKAVEINLSCPNEGVANLLCFDIDRTKEIVERVKDELGNTPLAIKIAYFKDKKHLEKLVLAVGKTVDAISAINTIPGKILNKDGSFALGENRSHSGICGHPIKWAGIETVRELKKLRKKHHMAFEIVGVGGVTSYADFKKYRDAGADVVKSATGAMWNPYLAQEIKIQLGVD